MRHLKSLIEICLIILILIGSKINLNGQVFLGTPANFEDYIAMGLSVDFSKLTVTDYERIPGISTTKALELVKIAPKSCSELVRVKGLGEKKLQIIFKLLNCNSSKY